MGRGHLSSSLSWVEIAIALFTVMKPDDRLVLSKTHGHLTLDTILDNQIPCYPMWPGWPFRTSGSLGMGLGMAAGMALANKLNGSDARVFCVLGDAELHEGAIWEAIMFISHHRLNVTAIVDDNKQCTATWTKSIQETGPLFDKMQAFRWPTRMVKGHDQQALEKAFSWRHQHQCVIADTVKGKGISFMENDTGWHYRIPSGELIEQARKELA